jgi:hypothetical protein
MKLIVNKSDTARAMRNLDKLLKNLSQTAFVATKANASDYVNLVKSGIGVTRTPGFVKGSWAPLSLRWKSLKRTRKEEFWAETLGIYRSVQVNIIQKTLYFANVFAGIMKSTDAAAFDRAMRNEYGFGLGPARPLFKPAMDHLAPVAGKGMRRYSAGSIGKKRFEDALRKAVRMTYK